MPMFLPRYLVYTTPGWCLLAGAALARIRPVWIVTALVTVAVITIPAHVSMRGPGGHGQATAQLGLLLARYAQPGDAVVYADDKTVGAWTARDAVAHYVPASLRPDDVLATHPPRTAGLLLPAERTDAAAGLDDAPRVWVIRIGTLADPLAGVGAGRQEALTRAYRIDRVWYPTGLTLALLRRS
jgi:mannosyltransferase